MISYLWRITGCWTNYSETETKSGARTFIEQGRKFLLSSSVRRKELVRLYKADCKGILNNSFSGIIDTFLGCFHSFCVLGFVVLFFFFNFIIPLYDICMHVIHGNVVGWKSQKIILCFVNKLAPVYRTSFRLLYFSTGTCFLHKISNERSDWTARSSQVSSY